MSDGWALVRDNLVGQPSLTKSGEGIARPTLYGRWLVEVATFSRGGVSVMTPLRRQFGSSEWTYSVIGIEKV